MCSANIFYYLTCLSECVWTFLLSIIYLVLSFFFVPQSLDSQDSRAYHNTELQNRQGDHHSTDASQEHLMGRKQQRFIYSLKMLYTAVYKIVSYSVYVPFFFLLSLTYHQHCSALVAFLLKEFFLQRWRPYCFPAIPVTIVAIVAIVAIVVFITVPPRTNVS